MKYKVNYTASAKRDIRGIYEYVAYQLIEPDTAADLVPRIQSAISRIILYTLMGNRIFLICK